MTVSHPDDETPAGAPPADDESFPELDAFLAEQQARHASLIRNVFIVSVLCVGVGVGLLLWALLAEATMPMAFAGGLFLTGAGVVGMGRMALSRFTDVDERPLPYGEDAKKLEAKLLQGE